MNSTNYTKKNDTSAKKKRNTQLKYHSYSNIYSHKKTLKIANEGNVKKINYQVNWNIPDFLKDVLSAGPAFPLKTPAESHAFPVFILNVIN